MLIRTRDGLAIPPHNTNVFFISGVRPDTGYVFRIKIEYADEYAVVSI